MNRRPPQLAPLWLLAALLAPLVLYVVLRQVTGSPIEALALTEVIPAGWLVLVAIVRRRFDAIGVVSTASVAIALAIYGLSGGDPVALKLRHGVVPGTVGIIALASLALGRPLLLVVAQRRAEIDAVHRAEIEAKLDQPDRRRALVVLTLLLGMFFTLDGAVQTVLAFAVPTDAFVPDSTTAHLVVLGGGAAVMAWYLQHQKERRRQEQDKRRH
jgi:hypothetical protein